MVTSRQRSTSRIFHSLRVRIGVPAISPTLHFQDTSACDWSWLAARGCPAGRRRASHRPRTGETNMLTTRTFAGTNMALLALAGWLLPATSSAEDRDHDRDFDTVQVGPRPYYL